MTSIDEFSRKAKHVSWECFQKELKKSYKYFRHCGANGDMLYAIPSITACGGGVIFLVKKNQYYFMKTLLIKQPCFIDIRQRDYHWVQYSYLKRENLLLSGDGWRDISVQNPNKLLLECNLEFFGVTADLFRPWLFNVDKKCIRKIVIHRSDHYHSIDFDWSPLAKWSKEIVMIGTEREMIKLTSKSGIDPLFYKVKDALEMAEIIHGSSLFIGNQSLPFAIAEGLKIPRVVERRPGRDNCYLDGSPNLYPCFNDDLIEKCLDSR